MSPDRLSSARSALLAVAAPLLAGLLVASTGCSAGSSCPAGLEGCACLESGGCRRNDLACVEGLCVSTGGCADGSCRPIETRCFTPCSGDFTDEAGRFRRCSAEGLTSGCLAGATCHDATCVPLRAELLGTAELFALGSCGRDGDCPDFQRCAAGRCRSGCEAESDCEAGWTCFRQVCRQGCEDTVDCTTAGQVCTNQVCLEPPTGDPGPGDPPPEDGAAFSLAPNRLYFTSSFVEDRFAIRNESGRTRSFTVRKLEETVPHEDGPRVVRADEGETPLPWLQMGAGFASAQDRFLVTVAPGEQAEIVLGQARNPSLSRWSGRIEVSSEDLGRQVVHLSYSQDVRGRWSGRVHAFGNFEDGARPEDGDWPLEAWVANRRDAALADRVPNAFVQAWSRFRNNGFSAAEMQAVVSTTLDGSWQSQRVSELCEEAGYGSGAVCAPFGGTGSDSVILYSSSSFDTPVPSGSAELDLALNLRPATPDEVAGDPGCRASEHCFVGRIDTAEALQYGANPAAHLVFEADPTECATEGSAGCMAFLSSFEAEVAVGARYFPAPGDEGCGAADGLEPSVYPWLVVGFAPTGVRAGEEGEQRTRTECRDSLVPYSGEAWRNPGYAAANPVPDGIVRRRRIELVDGILLEQHVMMLLLREVVDPFQGGDEPIVSYLYAVLQKQPAEPEPRDYVGGQPVDEREGQPSMLRTECSDDLVWAVTRTTRPIGRLDRFELGTLARAVVRGDSTAVGGEPPISVGHDGSEAVHSLCAFTEHGEDTAMRREVFGAGPDGRVPCPLGATEIYFTLSTADFGEGFDPSLDPCAATRPETCFETLEGWVETGRGVRLSAQARSYFPDAPAEVPFDLLYSCEGGGACDRNPYDLLAGKRFYTAEGERAFFHPIETDIREAFRYRTLFASRSGRNVGFVPVPCQGGGLLEPYCYDHLLIEEVEERVDCALAVYQLHLETEGTAEARFDRTDPDDAATLDTLRLFLEQSFSQSQRYDALGRVEVEPGFERLSAELLIMLGDDAYAESFASRFDLAGANLLTFAGDRFEANGVLLSGAAGYELYRLYQATQYYQMVLDRFFRLSPLFWASLGEGPADQYLRPETVTVYLSRVTRASTQAAAAWSEVARRYQALNRPDLARSVLERAYTRAAQESGILTGLMSELTRVLGPAALPQVRAEIETAQRSYRVAMVRMAQGYDSITEDLGFFGLPPDHIPFPAVETEEANGFAVVFERAVALMEAASTLEDRALESARDFEVDEAAFQAELVAIRNDHESQLGALCGTFVGVDGRVYPSIQRYAHLSAETARLSDPCGAVGYGAIRSQLATIAAAELDLRRVRQQLENLRAQALDQQEWVAIQCEMIADDVAAFLTAQRAVDDWQGSIDQMNTAIEVLDRGLEFVATLTERVGDVADPDPPWTTAIKASQNIVWMIASGVHFVATTVLEAMIDQTEARIRERQRQYQAWTMGRQCDRLAAELGFTLRGLQREMDLGELDALRATMTLQNELARLRALGNDRIRLEGVWRESEQMAINVAAARTDPNVRIFRNDAIINADRAFERAIREAYRATRIFEYHTAAPYPNMEELFLIRMVDRGDLNLRGYLAELEQASWEFEETYGLPDARVSVISVRDDVFQVPRYSLDGLGTALSAEDRVLMFRSRLAEPGLRDAEGNLSIQFSTTFDDVSPLTVNHKILFVEVEVFGQTGDDEGRFYMRQTGTGVVRDARGDRLYYTFPPRTAVVNPVFNGDRVFTIPGPNVDIYRSFRFRERPFVQTRWELVVDQRRELVNQDIDLGGLDDILIYVYYTDYTP